MPQQVHATPARSTTASPQEMEELAAADTPHASPDHVTVEDIDEILSDIDTILEENVLEILQRFVQKGGE